MVKEIIHQPMRFQSQSILLSHLLSLIAKMSMILLLHIRIIDQNQFTSQVWKLLLKIIDQIELHLEKVRNRLKLTTYNKCKSNQIHLSIQDTERETIHQPMRYQSQSILLNHSLSLMLKMSMISLHHIRIIDHQKFSIQKFIFRKRRMIKRRMLLSLLRRKHQLNYLNIKMMLSQRLR